MPSSSPTTVSTLRGLLGVAKDEPAVTMERLAELRSFPSGSAARQFVMRHRAHIAFIKRGRRVLVTLADFDRGCAQMQDRKRSA